MILIALLAAQAATAFPPPIVAPPTVASTDEERFRVCVEIAENEPARALDQAGAWRVNGGGVLARHCEALAYVAQKRWVPAATAFEAAARDADTKADGRSANLWVQAGNAALAANDPTRARAAFDAALARGQSGGIDQGEIYLDRARARFTLNDKAGARADLDSALKLAPADPLAWLLSATLARQSGDLERAATDIAEAAKRSPDDAQVALEAGNIAILSGREDAARTAWAAAVKSAPESAAGKAAAEALARLDKPS